MMIQKLGDVCDFYTGNGFPIKYQGKSIGELPFYKVGDIANNVSEGNVFLEFCGNYISRNEAKELKVQIVPKNTIVFAKIGEAVKLNRRAITSRDCLIDNNCMGIMPKDDLDLKYFYYFMKNLKMERLAETTTVPSVKKSKLENLKFNFSIKEDQIKIGQQLDKIYLIVLLQKKQLQYLDDLIKARFVEMFGDIHNSKLYPYVNIDSITTVLSGGTPDRKVEEYWDNGSIRWVKTTELQNCVITDTEERITQAGMDNSSAKIVPIGSVLIAMYGQGKTRGMTGYLAVECTTNQACACILPTKKINQIFLWKYMILSYDKLRNMAKGGNQPNLNIGLIKKFPILFPPIELQNEFADFVRQIDKSKFEVQKSLEKTQQLYDSLMQKYFG